MNEIKPCRQSVIYVNVVTQIKLYLLEILQNVPDEIVIFDFVQKVILQEDVAVLMEQQFLSQSTRQLRYHLLLAYVLYQFFVVVRKKLLNLDIELLVELRIFLKVLERFEFQL